MCANFGFGALGTLFHSVAARAIIGSAGR
jgi:hypothetical protein